MAVTRGILNCSSVTDTENSVQRNRFDIILEAEILLGNPNSVYRTKPCDIFIQAGCRDILAALYFHRD